MTRFVTHRFALLLIAAPTFAALFAAQQASAQDWPIGTPESQGMDSSALATIVEQTDQSPLSYTGSKSLLVIRNGVKVLDAYFYPYEGDRPHFLASAQKSVQSILIGIAMDQGLFPLALDQPIWELFLDDYPDLQIDGGKENITLRHLLTMTSGLNCGPDGVAIALMQASDDWIRHVLDLDLLYVPGSQFAYCTPTAHLLNAVITKVSGQSAYEFAQQHLFTPLGIHNAEWPVWPACRQEVTIGELLLDPYGLAKIGELYLNEGMWNGNRVVSSEWVTESTEGNYYAYLWWIPAGFSGAYEAYGNGGQRLFVWPEKQLIVTSFGGISGGSAAVANAVESDGVLDHNQVGYDRLMAAVANAANPPSACQPQALSSLAVEVSGRIYQLEDNAFGLHCYSVKFDPGQLSEARMTLTMAEGSYTLPVGMDCVPRFTQGDIRGSQVGVTGRWLGASFHSEYHDIGGPNHIATDADFGADSSTVTLTFSAAFGYVPDVTVEAHRIDASSCPVSQGGVVATGHLQAVSNYGDLSGSTITWDDAKYPVFGAWDVNLGTEPGIHAMEIPPGFGSAGPNAGSGTPPHGSFTANFESADLSLSSSGEYVCPNSANYCGSERPLPDAEFDVTYVSSRASLGGSFVTGGYCTLPTELDGVPIQYSIDGSEQCYEAASQLFVCDGRINLNAFRAVNTEPGGSVGDPADVVDVPFNTVFTDPDTGTQTPLAMTITYDAMASEGYTNVVTTSQAGGTINPSFSIDVPGLGTVFFDVSMDPRDAFSGEWIRVCTSYPESVESDCDLRLLHNDDEDPDAFIDQTLEVGDVLCPFTDAPSACDDFCIDTAANQICAEVERLSAFVFATFVPNEPPVIETFALTPTPAAVGEVVEAVATVCDPDFEHQPLTARIDWGDGDVTEITTSAAECEQYVGVSHPYAEAGVYTVIITVTDSYGATDSEAFQYAVIYDPDGGFVTGGGWIDSAAGAYVADPLLAGKANFGFVSKYQKGASVPTGNTEFQFRVADLNFKSMSYEWLVTTGKDSAKFKGEGTINGEGSYRFMLQGGDGTGTDGEDTFRIRIWTEDEAAAVETDIYDNGFDQDLGGGSIVVHTAK